MNTDNRYLDKLISIDNYIGRVVREDWLEEEYLAITLDTLDGDYVLIPCYSSEITIQEIQ